MTSIPRAIRRARASGQSRLRRLMNQPRLAIETLEARSLLAVTSISFSNTLTPTAGIALSPSQQIGTFYTNDTVNPVDLSFYRATIEWGDGTSSVGTISTDPSAGFDITGAHTYAQATSPVNPDIMNVTVYDFYDNTSFAATNNVAVADQAPVATLAQPTVAATQGLGLVNADVATFTDANPLINASYFSALINWGDGASTAGTIVEDGTGASAIYHVEGSHTYSSYAEAGYGITVTVSDPASTVVIDTDTATITPGALLISPAPLTFSDGSVNLSNQPNIPAGTVVGSFTDASGAQSAANYETLSSFVTFPGATGNTPVTIDESSPNGNSFLVETDAATLFTSPFQPGSESYTLQIGDNNGRVAFATGSLTITGAALTANNAPTITPVVAALAATPTVAEFTVANSLATAGQFTATINWGDGTPASIGTLTAVSSSAGISASFSIAGTHAYAYASSSGYPVTVTVDELGNVNPLVLTNTIVVDAALTAGTPPTVAPLIAGTSSTTTIAKFTAGAPIATIGEFSATIQWGDGTPSSIGTVSQPGGVGTPFFVSGTHTYANYSSAGYPVIVTVQQVGTPTPLVLTHSITVSEASLTVATPQPTVSAVAGQPFAGVPVATFIYANAQSAPGDFSATISWGSHALVATTSGTIVLVGGSSSGNTFEVLGADTYTSYGTSDISVTVTDLADTSINPSTTATVSDAGISAMGSAISAVQSTAFTGTVATFTDANPYELVGALSATINWGDGTAASAGTVTQPGGVGTAFVVTGTHTFASIGSFTTGITIVSNGGATAVATGSAAVSSAPLTEIAGAQPYIHTTEEVPYNGPVATFTVASSNVTPSDFLATINWGTGQPVAIGVVTETASVPGVSSTFAVSSSYDYLNSGVNGGTGTFPVSVNVVNLQGGSLVVSNTAYVADRPIDLVGQLNPASDSGISNLDAITNVTQPNFFGTSEAYSTVYLSVTPTTGGSPRLVGETEASGAGNWSITSSFLTDGAYTVTATAVDQFGVTTAATQLLPNASQGSLVIDTAAPKITSVKYDPLTAKMYVTYQDPEGELNQASLTSGANYRVVNSGIKIGSVLVTKLTAGALTGPGGEQTVVVTLDHGKRIKGGGPLYVTILSGGIGDVAGNALSGSFFGTFPSGTGLPGSNFQAMIALFTGRVSTFPYYSTVHTNSVPRAVVSHALSRPSMDLVKNAVPTVKVRTVVAQAHAKVEHAIHESFARRSAATVESDLIERVGHKP